MCVCVCVSLYYLITRYVKDKRKVVSRSSFPCIYLYIRRINQKMHNVLFYIYFHFFPDMFRHLHAILKRAHSNYIKLYRALTPDSY
jgi:hypothetical protein